MRRRLVIERADHALAARAEHERLAERVEQRQRVEQREVLGHRLAEADAWIEDDPFTRDPAFDRAVARGAQPVEHLEHDIAVARARVQVVPLAGRVHQDDRNSARSDELEAARIVPQRRDVVDQVCSRGERRLHHLGPARVDADRRAHRRAVLDRGNRTLDLVAFPHRGRAGPGAFPADVDNRRPGLVHRRGVRPGFLGIVEELAAVGEAVGRDVENAHDLRLVEPDRPLAQLQRRVRRGESGPLPPGLGPELVGQPLEHPVDARGGHQLALHHPALPGDGDGHEVGISHAPRQPDRVAGHGLRARDERERLDVDPVHQSSMARR